MSMKGTTAGLALVMLTAGCSAELGPSEPLFLWVGASESDEARLVVRLWGGDEKDCATARSDLQGSVNGVPLEVKSFGGRLDNGSFSPPCAYIDLRGPLPTAPDDLTIRISDRTTRIEAVFPNFFVEHSVALVEPTDQLIHIGDRVVLSFAPPDPRMWRLVGHPYVYGLNAEGTYDSRTKTVSLVAMERWESAFRIPLTISFNPNPEVVATQCSGASRCTGRQSLNIRGAAATFVNQERGNDQICYKCDCICDALNKYSFPSDGTPVRCSTMTCLADCPIDQVDYGLLRATCVSSGSSPP